MPRYRFNIEQPFTLGRVEDEEGLDLTGLDAARAEATCGVRSLLADELRFLGVIDLRGDVQVTDEAGTVLLSVPFAEAMQIIGFESGET